MSSQAMLILNATLLSLAMGLVGPTAHALEPPPPGEIAELQRTGQLEQRIEAAKALGNHRVDSYRLKKAILGTAQEELQRQGKSLDDISPQIEIMAPPLDWKGMPTTGKVKILTLLIEFTDYPHTQARSYINSNLFGMGDSKRFPYESLAAYYKRASYEQLDLSSGKTFGWYQAGVKRSAITQTTAGRENLIKKALNYYKSKGQNFKQFDNDGDGVIDYLVVIWTGPDNGWGNFWWGYMTNFEDTQYRVDGVGLNTYSWQWETNARQGSKSFTPLVVIHETGHALGLPDYYDYDDNVGPQGGVGGLDMMDHNMGDHNCFSKWMLGWLSPTVISSGSQSRALSASGASPNCVAIWPGLEKGQLFSELFLAQNRYRVGNDETQAMPGDGMLIWHVDAHLNDSGSNFIYDNSFTPHKLLRLMEADGLEEIELNKGANAGDYYKSPKVFGPMSSPSSKRYDGWPSGVKVSSISLPSKSMTARFAIIPPPK